MKTSTVRLAGLVLSLALIAAACGGNGAEETTTTSSSTTSTTAPPTDPTDPTDPTETTDPEPLPGRSAEALESHGILAAANALTGRISGAGASFPNPLYLDWIFEYSNPASGIARQPGSDIDYQSIGSGGGRTQFIEQTVDWGTSEAYIHGEQHEQAEANRGCTAFQVPIVYGSVSIAFGNPDFDELILDAAAISAIYRGAVTNWSDPQIAELNPGRDLPDLDIIVIHRSDNSGTTQVFTTWLSDEDEIWADEIGLGGEVAWPVGVGGQGNEGVSAQVTISGPGSVGYMSQAYALELALPQARVVNADGNAVFPTLEATTAAVDTLVIPDNFQFDILGVGGDGYPITGTVWNLFYECGYDSDVADLLIDFWSWATQSDEADEAARRLGFAPLGESLKQRVLAAIQRINIQDS